MTIKGSSRLIIDSKISMKLAFIHQHFSSKKALDAYHVYIPVLDDHFTLHELNLAIQTNGRCTALDMTFSHPMYFSTLSSVQKWTKQLLRPEKKEGHTEKDPKFRDIAISQFLHTLYDMLGLTFATNQTKDGKGRWFEIRKSYRQHVSPNLVHSKS